ISIAVPRIGAGYGGLSWRKVRALIEAAFKDWSGTLFVNEEYAPEEKADSTAGRPGPGPAGDGLLADLRLHPAQLGDRETSHDRTDQRRGRLPRQAARHRGRQRLGPVRPPRARHPPHDDLHGLLAGLPLHLRGGRGLPPTDNGEPGPGARRP